MGESGIRVRQPPFASPHSAHSRFAAHQVEGTDHLHLGRADIPKLLLKTILILHFQYIIFDKLYAF